MALLSKYLLVIYLTTAGLPLYKGMTSGAVSPIVPSPALTIHVSISITSTSFDIFTGHLAALAHVFGPYNCTDCEIAPYLSDDEGEGEGGGDVMAVKHGFFIMGANLVALSYIQYELNYYDSFSVPYRFKYAGVLVLVMLFTAGSLKIYLQMTQTYAQL
ncbi:hypothetical protein C2E23DRAFT_862784 [Lenzites betulinus]|nr:hypothetical protein C2E23DRAFT_862784 [Lenzites betulinus]